MKILKLWMMRRINSGFGTNESGQFRIRNDAIRKDKYQENEIKMMMTMG